MFFIGETRDSRRERVRPRLRTFDLRSPFGFKFLFVVLIRLEFCEKKLYILYHHVRIWVKSKQKNPKTKKQKTISKHIMIIIIKHEKF